MLKNLSWEDAFFFLLWSFCGCIIVLLFAFVLANKQTKMYSLHGDSGGCLQIQKETEWSFDETITLDRSVTYQEAIQMIDSLNKTLPKK